MSTPESFEPVKLFVGTSVILDEQKGWKISFDHGVEWAVDNLEQTERKFVKKYDKDGNLVMGPNLTSIPKDSMFSRFKSKFMGNKQSASGGKRKSSKKKRTRKSKRNKKSKTRRRR